MPRIVKFGSQFGRPKGPRMPSMKARAPKMPGGSVMKMKFAKGGSTDEGSRNEAMRPFGRPDPEIVRSIEGAPAAAEAKLNAIRRAQAAQRAERAAQLKAALARPRAGMKKGGSVSPASKRADGCVTKGKTKGKFV